MTVRNPLPLLIAASGLSQGVVDLTFRITMIILGYPRSSDTPKYHMMVYPLVILWYSIISPQKSPKLDVYVCL